MASAVSQVGCVTVVIVVGALMAGLGLDKVFDTRPLFTILLLLGSVPVSLYLLVRIALSAAAQLNPPPTKKSTERTDVPAQISSEDVPSKEE